MKKYSLIINLQDKKKFLEVEDLYQLKNNLIFYNFLSIHIIEIHLAKKGLNKGFEFFDN